MKTTPQDILTSAATAREYLLGIEILVQKARKQRRNPADVEARLDCPMRIEPYTIAELVAAAKKRWTRSARSNASGRSWTATPCSRVSKTIRRGLGYPSYVHRLAISESC